MYFTFQNSYYLPTVGVHNAQICSIVRALYMSPCGGSARYVDGDGWPDGVPVVAVKPPDFPHHASPGGRERLVGRSAADVGGTQRLLDRRLPRPRQLPVVEQTGPVVPGSIWTCTRTVTNMLQCLCKRQNKEVDAHKDKTESVVYRPVQMTDPAYGVHWWWGGTGLGFVCVTFRLLPATKWLCLGR